MKRQVATDVHELMGHLHPLYPERLASTLANGNQALSSIPA